MNDATIAVSGLRKRFGATTALDGMSFTVRPGSVTGFVGPNGAGKSTTMRVVLGLDAADAGTALIGGGAYPSPRPTPPLFGAPVAPATPPTGPPARKRPPACAPSPAGGTPPA